jgi:hypothetical protein
MCPLYRAERCVAADQDTGGGRIPPAKVLMAATNTCTPTFPGSSFGRVGGLYAREQRSEKQQARVAGRSPRLR